MSSGLAFDAKEQVRQAVDIVDLVGDYLQLRREGRGFKAICPWHNDTRPSLQVNQDRQSFRCWVCDIGGDIFAFLMKMEGVTFPEALNMLADRAGIQITTRGGSPSEMDAKRTLYQAMAWAEEQYHQFLLNSPEAEGARKYLTDRGITTETVRKYHIGFSPEKSWDWILQQARSTRFTPQVLETIGIAIQSQRGGFFDRFKGRVLFSIRDSQARPVGMGGRILPGNTDERAAKYVNTPETPLFSKSSLLYGLDAARDTLSKSRTAVVMEGYTDALVAQQYGFGNALAVLGTALGERHIRLLRRFVDQIVLVLDGDEAGRRRTDQILELFVAEQMDLRVLTLPDNLDPCDFLHERGAQAFSGLLDQAVDALEHRFILATGGVTAATGTHAANKALEEVLATLAKAPRLQSTTTSAVRLKEDQILHRLSQKFGLSETRLRERLTELRRGGRRPASAPGEDVSEPAGQEISKHTLAERWLLEILLQSPDLLPEIERQVQATQFTCPRRRAIFALCCKLHASGTQPTFERLMLETDEPELKSTLVELDEERQAKCRPDSEKELRDLLMVFRDQQMRLAPEACRVPVGPAIPQEEQELEALRHLIEQKRSRQGISRSMDG